MKKILIIALSLLLLTGCTSDEEKENMLYTALEKAYIVQYSIEGPGLPVYDQEKTTVDGKDYYMVALSDYTKISRLLSLAEDAFTTDLSKEVSKTINEKYMDIDNELYTISEGGCVMPYLIDKELQDNLKKNIKIKKVKMNSIVFEYEGKEYTAKEQDDKYVLSDKVFVCEESTEE